MARKRKDKEPRNKTHLYRPNYGNGNGGNSSYNPLIDEKGVFTRGKHEGKSLEEIGEESPDYLNFLYFDSKISDDAKAILEDFFEKHPEYYDG